MKARKVERKRTDIKGQCRTNQGRLFDIKVCDLTEGGCRFRDADQGLSPGVQVALMIAGSGPYRCFVRWRDESQVGVSFSQSLSPEVLEQLLNGKPVNSVPAASMQESSEPAADSRFGPLRRVC